jgi:hypothetical protein
LYDISYAILARIHMHNRPERERRPYARWAIGFVAAAFVFRLLFGLSSELFFEDETQIFLIGLRYYATGHWPYFGPDVVWTKSEIPGALQGLLVGLPLRALPVPEAPYVLLNLLSAIALAAQAWYTCARVPTVPRWLVWGWLFTMPWTLQFSTHIINPSYVLPAAVAFFIGFFEAAPAFRRGLVPPAAGFALMGAALLWVMQIHMSWPLLGPYIAYAAFTCRRDGGRHLAIYALAFAAGALIPGAALAPTWLYFGGQSGSGGVLRNIHVHAVNPFIVVTTIARFFSFASLEIVRFIATDNAKRLEFFLRNRALVPLAIVVWTIGIAQPVWMLIEWFRHRASSPEWTRLRWLVAASVLLVYASYWFVMEPPQAHAFYVLAPIAWLFAAWCWTFIDGPRARIAAAAVLTISIAFHAGLAWAQAPDRSLYKNRAPVAAAVAFKEPEMLAHRRAFAVDGGPSSLQDPTRPYDPTRDIEVTRSVVRIGIAGSLNWTIVVRNANPRVAFRDLQYETTYLDDSGRIVDERHEFIKDIFEPGAVREVLLNDRFLVKPFASATLRIVAAEALLPDTSPNVRE